ncbi:hypothetical protein THTE_0692 [Thermogutta terrifontis]|uniref:Uncharacterized protein n=1 Tax=Thermogutta terrifontis TaxID=1331910 RepID=A0A286RBE7_9BACT|nr:hypothetical protein THTE_0692 [Thermogutta terrifontis]
MECGDLSPLFGEGFSLHNLGVCGVGGTCLSGPFFGETRLSACEVPLQSTRVSVGAIHELPLQRRKNLLVGSD